MIIKCSEQVNGAFAVAFAEATIAVYEMTGRH